MTRPIAQIALSQPGRGHNPREWLPELLAGNFRDNLYRLADTVAAIGREVDAQGVLIQDIEGSAYYDVLGYPGDPARCQRYGAPEMTRATARAFVKRLRDNGLKVGLTLRHTRIVENPTGTFFHVEPWDVVQSIIRKIDDAAELGAADYAYLDSNCDWLYTRVLDVRHLQHVRQARPDTLLIPEHADESYRGLDGIMPLRITREGKRQGRPGGEVVQVMFGDEYRMPADEVMRELREDFAAGSTPMFRGWYRSPELDVLKRLRAGE